MADLTKYQQEFLQNGFTVLDNIYSGTEVEKIISVLQQADTSGPAFRKTSDLFAVRRFLQEVPQVFPLVFTERLRSIINEVFGNGYFVVKSIYFDKPGASNWFVSYHQDLTISVDRKADVAGFGPWTVKEALYAVQPPLDILEHNFTVRIHLDDTDENNGALRVVPGSHLKGIFRPEPIGWTKETEVICNVLQGGIMLMRPLLLHASGRTKNNKRRRVIHIEFSDKDLPEPLGWAEQVAYQQEGGEV